jgi:hypothetical protein
MHGLTWPAQAPSALLPVAEFHKAASTSLEAPTTQREQLGEHAALTVAVAAAALVAAEPPLDAESAQHEAFV